MDYRIRSRPARNGSGGSTLEILIAFTVLAAGTLTALALRPDPSNTKGRDGNERESGRREDG